MTRDEFRRFGAGLREKTHRYKRLKGELSELRAEAVCLHRTEQVLRGRVADVDAFLRDLETRKGVRGYRDARARLEGAAAATAAADEDKARTLEEISEMVRDISTALRARKAELAPQIKKLRDVRAAYQALEADFAARKRGYDKVAVGLEVDRQQLERECDAYQEEALSEESRYHYLHALAAMADATRRRVDDEAARRAGRGRALLPNFASYEALYAHKVAQQQAFVDQLRKQKAQLEATAQPRALLRVAPCVPFTVIVRQPQVRRSGAHSLRSTRFCAPSSRA